MAAWSAPVNAAAPLNSAANDGGATLSQDGLTIIFASNRFADSRDLWFAKRSTVNGPWQTPVRLALATSATGYETAPALSADGLTLLFSVATGSGGAFETWACVRAAVDQPWLPPVKIRKLGGGACQSADGQSFITNLQLSGGYGSNDLYLIRRLRKPPATATGGTTDRIPTVNLAEWGKFFDRDGVCGVQRAERRVEFQLPGTKPLRLSPTDGDMNAPRLVHEAEGDFVVQVVVPSFAKATAETSVAGVRAERSAGLIVSASDADFLRFGRASFSDRRAGGSWLHAAWYAGGTQQSEQFASAHDVGNPFTFLQSNAAVARFTCASARTARPGRIGRRSAAWRCRRG
jgi:hypothetical protein